jgi:hypothetical protein
MHACNVRIFMCCRVNLGPGGMDALIRLGCGDMRRTLNIVQVSMSHMVSAEAGNCPVRLCSWVCSVFVVGWSGDQGYIWHAVCRVAMQRPQSR